MSKAHAHIPLSGRKPVLYLGAALGVFFLMCIAILTMLLSGKARLDRHEYRASNYHLQSLFHSSRIRREFDSIEHLFLTSHASETSILVVNSYDNMFGRSASIIREELGNLRSIQEEFADPKLVRALNRLTRVFTHFLEEYSAMRQYELALIDQLHPIYHELGMRIDQFDQFHFNGFRESDLPALKADVGRQFFVFTIFTTGGGLVIIIGLLRQLLISLRIRHRDEEHQKILMMELDHRVKNNLAAVLGLARQSLAQSASLEEFSESFIGRITAMARTHEGLARAKWEGIQLNDAVSLTLMSHLHQEPCRLRIAGQSVLLPSRTAMPICLVLHELATNSSKYGALSVPEGQVNLDWRLANHDLHINWSESDGPEFEQPVIPGLGMCLIEGLIQHELTGSVNFDFQVRKYTCRICFPLE